MLLAGSGCLHYTSILCLIFGMAIMPTISSVTNPNHLQVPAHGEGEHPSSKQAAVKAPTRRSVASLDHPILDYEIKASEKVNALAFSPDGTLIAAASDGKEIRVWDAAGSQSFRTFVDPFAYGQRVTSLAFSRNGQILASAQDIFENNLLGGNDIKLWVVSSGNLKRNIFVNSTISRIAPEPRRRDADATVYMKSIVFHPDGNTLLASLNVINVSRTSHGEIREWDLPTGNLKHIWPHESGIDSTALSPDGKTMAIGSDCKIELWDMATTRLLRTLNEGRKHGQAGTLCFSPDGRIIASGSGPQAGAYNGNPAGMIDVFQSVHFWSSGGSFLTRLSDSQFGTVTAVAFSPDGEHLAVGTSAAVVRLYRIK
jgi:WD40 repeat protein